ncbi:ABC transporter ATP-binding protein [Micromonospora sp. Llam7]|uniref:ABC transporter ATP-binding protein n=1 Tax=Micromonospora tarapacensis TaxID=2835305 RepID=UPI001C838789|nr:ABC transporter ATP-binding protein [Micromonospora tarapacensis]MBX7266832.1 ABC transporter ATP-binding protein [Micromonospora tarapacensis]
MAAETEPDAGGRGLLRSLLHSERHRLATAVLLAVAAVACQLVPYLMAYRVAVELVTEAAPDGNALIRYAVIALVAIAAGTALMGGALAISHVCAYRLLHRLRQRIAERLGVLPLGEVTRRGSGGIGKLAMEDVERIEVFVAHMLPDAVAALTVVAATTVWLFVIDWRLALAAVAVVPLAMLAMRRATRGSGAWVAQWHGAGMAMNQAVTEFLHGIKAVKVFNRQSDTVARATDAVRRYVDAETRWGKAFLPGGAAYFTVMAANVVVVVPVGLWLYRAGAVDLPTLLLFLLLSLGYTAPLTKLTGYGSQLRQVRFGTDEIARLLDTPALPDTGRRLPLGPATVELTGVSFGYHPDRQVLNGVDIHAEAGRVTAIVGPSGSGKTTVARLVSRFFDVSAGSVRVGGVDVREMAVDQLMDTVAVVFQDPFLFHDTVRANLTLGRPDLADEAVHRAARAARCHDFILALPQGYDTVVGERGATLSGGERQRISIARALLKDAPVVVLDEATASTDPENEVWIQEAVANLAAGRTLLVIAHRLTTVRDADQIVVMTDGRVTESGRHDELLGAGGTYAGLWADATTSARWSLGVSGERSGAHA